jgi:GTPase SAR1 family protein
MSVLLVHELHEARDRLLLLRDKLIAARQQEIPSYRDYLDEQVSALNKALDDARIPPSYRVAVVGRFKVGKSSFINKLTEEKNLAAVDANPETAAISIFRFSEETRAEIEFVTAEEWQNLTATHAENPKDPEAKRFAGFMGFNARPAAKDKDGKEIPRSPVDLHGLAAQWIKPGGLTHTIRAQNWKSRDGKQAFRRELRQFTSSQEPLHYLVKKLTIHAPIPLLRDHIELIDTPGLDDTERFRVQLTEELVREVDAILYLTTSGAAYGQTDKEFIIRQLRQQQLRHLQLIVTKADHTYADTLRDADEKDEPPPTFAEFRAAQVSRVRGEVRQTLDELLTSNETKEDEGYYFIEQLDSIGVHLISTKLHDEGKIEEGGIDAVREGLYRVLSTSRRFADSRRILVERLDLALNSIRARFSDRISAIERDYDPQRVKAEIESIKAALSKRLEVFEDEAGTLVQQLEQQQAAFHKTLPLKLDAICYAAREVIGSNELDDVGTHWKSRRHGNWGYLKDLQGRVADRVFPRVASNLTELRDQFSTFVGLFSTRVDSLQTKIRELEAEHHISGLETLSLADKQRPLFEKLEKEFDSMSEAARDSVLEHLDDFVTEQVLTRLDVAKASVATVWGKGTTSRQTGEVRKFYDQVKSLLADALREHLTERTQEFAAAIVTHAQSLAPRLRAESLGVIEQRIAAIESSLTLQSAEEKQRVLAYLQEMHGLVSNFAARPESITAHTSAADTTLDAGDGLGVPDSRPVVLQPTRYEIVEGSTGYTYERIFRPYIDTAEEIIVEDPYIRKIYQFDNFARFCALALRSGVVRKIALHSYCEFGEDIDEVRSRLETLSRDLKSRGVELTYNYEFRGHDREVRFSNGWRVNIGRGLDIYYPPESWASIEASDFSLRRCKGTKVDAARVIPASQAPAAKGQ